jgi:hypothetical protein
MNLETMLASSATLPIERPRPNVGLHRREPRESLAVAEPRAAKRPVQAGLGTPPYTPTTRWHCDKREAGVPVCLHDTPRVNTVAFPSLCEPPAWRGLREVDGITGSRDAGAGEGPDERVRVKVMALYGICEPPACRRCSR